MCAVACCLRRSLPHRRANNSSRLPEVGSRSERAFALQLPASPPVEREPSLEPQHVIEAQARRAMRPSERSA